MGDRPKSSVCSRVQLHTYPQRTMSAITAKLDELQSRGILTGNAITEEKDIPLGQYQEYEKGAIFYNACFYAHWMTDKVMQKWKSASVADTLAHNGKTIQAYLGFPVVDTSKKDDGTEVCIFEQGMIVCRSNGDSVVVYGPIFHKYLGSDIRAIDSSFPNWMGYPTEDVSVDQFGSGMKGLFEHADIYCQPDVGAFALRGSIRDRYRAILEEYNDGEIEIGYPTSDEYDILKEGDVVGKANNFQGGTIYWSEKTGAWAVQHLWGTQDSSYLATYNGPIGELGFPTANGITPYPGRYRFNNFEHGILVWRGSTQITQKITGLELKILEIHTKGKADASGSDDPYLEIRIGTRLTIDEWNSSYRFPNQRNGNDDIEEDTEGRLYYKNMNTIIVPEDQQRVCLIPINDGNQILTINIETRDYDAGDSGSSDNVIGRTIGTYDIETLWNTMEPVAIARDPNALEFNGSGGNENGAAKVIFSLTPV
jgi:LGFP repeat